MFWARMMVQIIEGTADHPTITSMLPPNIFPHQESSNDRRLKPNIIYLAQVIVLLQGLVMEAIKMNDMKYSKYCDPLVPEEVNFLQRSSIRPMCSKDANRKPKLSRKIGTLYESLSLQDKDLYHSPSSPLNEGAFPFPEQGSLLYGIEDERESATETEDNLILEGQRLNILAMTLLELRDVSKKIAELSPKSR